MENQGIIELVEDMVKEEIRNGNLSKSKDVLCMLPEIVESVSIDENKVRESIEQCLSTSNPFNAFLNLLGVQLIKKQKTINTLVESAVLQSEDSENIDKSYTKQWLTLNVKDFSSILLKVSQKLYELENQANEIYDDEKKRGDDLFVRYEKLVQEHNKLKYSCDMNEKMVAERIQYILSLGGKEEVSDNEQLIELLRDLNIEVYWDSNDAPLDNTVMFAEYKVDDETMVSTKPCLIKDGTVYIKGMRFIKSV